MSASYTLEVHVDAETPMMARRHRDCGGFSVVKVGSLTLFMNSVADVERLADVLNQHVNMLAVSAVQVAA